MIPTVQIFPQGNVRIVKRGHDKGLQIFPANGERNYVVPVEIARLAAGRDEWMKKVLICCECGKETTVGEFDCGLCPTCYDAAGEENYRLDTNPAYRLKALENI